MSWVTSTMVFPAARFSRNTSLHFWAKAASPTACRRPRIRATGHWDVNDILSPKQA